MADDGDEKIIPGICSDSATFDDAETWVINHRFSRAELVLRFLSLLCLSLMVGLFTIQLNIAWHSREILSGLGMEEDQFLYPAFYHQAHYEETWCWDPDKLLLKVNTSLFVR